MCESLQRTDEDNEENDEGTAGSSDGGNRLEAFVAFTVPPPPPPSPQKLRKGHSPGVTAVAHGDGAASWEPVAIPAGPGVASARDVAGAVLRHTNTTANTATTSGGQGYRG